MTFRLTVIGDVLLDIDLVGRARRLSPDAPVPVLDQVCEHPRPGGAALAAYLAAAGGIEVSLVAPMADDEPATQLRDLLGDLVSVYALPYAGSTPVKRRIRAGGQSVARIDTSGEAAEVGELTRPAVDALSAADAVLVSDYGRGLTAVPSIRSFLTTLPRKLPVVWDPHQRGAAPVPGVHLVTPNADEADTWVRRSGAATTVDAGAGGVWPLAARQAAALVHAWNAGAVVVTLGARGALLSHGQGAPVVVPAVPAPGQDTCGAGDAFAAAATTMLGTGRVTGEAVQYAVADATEFVQTGGASGLTASSPVIGRDRKAGRDVAAAVHARGGVVVATGGCFDLLHAGHVACLQAARRLGDALIVCLNSDASVRRLKGASRPVVPAEDRARILRALECVDSVEIFDDDTPQRLLRQLKPDLWAKGGDYAGTDLLEEPVVGEWGGQVVTLPYVEGRSTTALVDAVARSTTKVRELTTRRST
jgi:D-beta-D-heptose 7-phosphate kinase/D-beta-D-heptose 1-phosphate adenosyltransferase